MNNSINKDENVHRFALSAIRGDILEREREREFEKRERKRDREFEKEREKEREIENLRKRERYFDHFELSSVF